MPIPVLNPVEVLVGPLASSAWKYGVEKPIQKFLGFQEALCNLKSNLEMMQEVIKQLVDGNTRLDRPDSEMRRLTEWMAEAKVLVEKCTTGNKLLRFLKRPHRTDKLKKMSESLLTLMTVLNNAYATIDGRENLHLTRQILNDQGDVKEYLVRILYALRSCGSGATEEVTLIIDSPCMAPKPPDFTVGLGWALNDIKTMILDDQDCKLLVLTAPPGCGKTTLAKMLCHHQDIKSKFDTNVMFVAVSRKLNLSKIIGDLCSHNRIGKPPEPASFDGLRTVLRKIGEKPLLLILDDVWRGSEGLLDEIYNLKLPDFKILVTSRYKFPGFGISYKLEMLTGEDALALFRHNANLNSDFPDEIVDKVVRYCKNYPLALKLYGRFLRGQDLAIWESKLEHWSNSSFLENQVEGEQEQEENGLLALLQNSLQLLPGEEKLKECFTDLGSFPEDQRIAATTVLDVWKELHGLSEKAATANLYHLRNWNLAELVITRSDAEEKDGDYSEHFLSLHDMLRKLAIHQSKQENCEQKRMILELSDNDLPGWWNFPNQQSFDARLVSITTDESFSSEWPDIQLPKTEVLILNFQAENYAIPEFIRSMSELKLLIITNYSYFPATLTNFELLITLTNLKTIRFEGITIPSLSQTPMPNLQKLTMFMCKIGNAFSTINVAKSFRRLTEININYCKDLVALPSGLKNVTKLRVTHCHKLKSLLENIGGEMENVEVLSLRSCIELEELPESICEIPKLNFLDVSNCFSMRNLPDNIGKLKTLARLNIKGCSRLKDFPPTILELEQSLMDLACDEDMKELLELHLTRDAKIKVRVPIEDFNLNAL